MCLRPDYVHTRSDHITLFVFQTHCLQNSSLQTTLPPNGPQHLAPQACPPMPAEERHYHSRATAATDEGAVQRHNYRCCVCSIHVASVVQMRASSRGATVAVDFAAFVWHQWYTTVAVVSAAFMWHQWYTTVAVVSAAFMWRQWYTTAAVVSAAFMWHQWCR